MENYDIKLDWVGCEYAEDSKDSKFDYTINGIELNLVGEAYPTGRCLPYNPYNSLFEMQALAEDKDHNVYFVRWIFEYIGMEGYDAYDYSKPYECVRIDLPL